MPDLELLVRDGCHLCDSFLLDLLLDHPALAQRLQLRDVDAEPRVGVEFGLRIPVLRIAGTAVCEGRYDRDEVRAALGKLCTGPQGRDNAGGENRLVPKGLRE
jgi:hypothetical protein